MKKSLGVIMIALAVSGLSAQEADIRAVVDRMFAAMYQRDTVTLRQCFIPGASLLTYKYGPKGNGMAKGETVAEFLRGVALIGEARFEERLTGWSVLVDEGIASAWAPYEFYFEGAFSHCGVNIFQLINVSGDWKITQLTDTRRKGNCVDLKREEVVIDSLMDAWHYAASIADEDAFFGFMTREAVYIGTDPTERWLRDELRVWSEKYFARESAWDFKPVERHVQLDTDGTTAWVDELLDTWMGTCRSTGILKRNADTWTLIYYHLSISMPNDRVEAYRELLQK